MASPAERIKERLAIAEVVGAYIKLEKAGSNLKARCPFHAEKTPSFFVSPARNTYYCFGCGAKGDVFSFVEQFEGLDFKGALKVLAERAGVPLAFESPERRSERERLYALLATAAAFFQEQLSRTADAQDYLARRGVTPESISYWRIGYAPGGWRSLHEHLLERGFSSREVEKAGLARRGDHNYYDLFRGRVMFPIADSSGRVVAFSGRLFPEQSSGEEREAPKYVNSPETPLFNKSRLLYGFDKAKQAIRRFNFSLLVEGQMDLVMSHQAGFRNTVAVSGTSLTDDQTTLLSRMSKNIVLAFDADVAGVASVGRSAMRALLAGMNVKVAALPPGVDPADLVQSGREKWKEVVRDAKHIVEFYLDTLAERAKDERDYRLLVEEHVVPFVARIASRIDQAHFVNFIAQRLGVPEAPIWETVRSSPAASDTDGSSGGESRYAVVKNPPRSRRAVIEEKLRALIIWQEQLPAPQIETTAVREKLSALLGEAYADALLARKEEEREEPTLFEAEMLYGEAADLHAEVAALLSNLELEYLREAFAKQRRALKSAEQEDNHEEVTRLLTECKRLSERITALRSVDTD